MEEVGSEAFGSEVRYTVRYTLMPTKQEVTFTVVTSLGELKAAAVAGIRKATDFPDLSMGEVEIVKIETEFTLDQEHDLIDYWGTNI
jgi:hypothetical protein